MNSSLWHFLSNSGLEFDPSLSKKMLTLAFVAGNRDPYLCSYVVSYLNQLPIGFLN